MSICDQFELASGAKVNRGKSEAMFFGNWANQSFIPSTVRTEKLTKRNTFDHKSVRKWSARSVLQTLRGKERVDPVAWFPEQTVKVIGQNASSPELSNEHQDITWLLNKELTPTECLRLARSKVQDYLLSDAPKLRAAATK
eukprot:g43388.t1